MLLGEAVALGPSEGDALGVLVAVPDGVPAGVLNGTTTAGRASIGAGPLPWRANAPSPKDVNPMAPDTAHKVERCDIGISASSRPSLLTCPSRLGAHARPGP